MPLDQAYDAEARARAARVRLVVFDCDGVLTDGGLVLSDSGEEHKVFNSRDGQGLVMLRESGIEVAVISGRTSPAVSTRMADLGIAYVFQGRHDKLATLEALLQRLEISASEMAYMGDDLPDLPPMRRAGLAVAVADAHALVLRQAHWCTRRPGGRGAARELCELILEARGLMAGHLARYLGITGEPP
ncbi:MAG: KdsC family phosphatase [Gammaproteobacteria bacterium]